MLKRLAALAGAVGTIVVGSMATDTWQATRSGVARLLGRGEPARRVVIGAQRDEVNAALVAMASARNGRRAQAPVLRGLGRSVPARRVCIGLLLLALVPRMVGLTADLPYMHHPDEPVNLRVIDAMVSNGDANPHFFNYPSLFFYLHAAFHLDGPLLGWIPGLAELAPVSALMGVSYAPTPAAVMVHRGVTVALGILVVLVGWVTARRVTTGVLPAAVTAMLLALSPTLITHSRFVTPDMPTALLVAVAVLASVRLLRSGSWLAYTVSGLTVGLATSMKYTAVLVAVPVIFAALLRSTDRAGFRRAAAGLPLAGACAVLAFLATTPYALLDRPAFLKGLEFERQHYATGHAGMDGNAPGFYAGYLATHEGLLVALALVAVVAVTVWDRQRWRVAVVLGSFPVIYSAVVAMQSVRNDRTIMLVLAPLAVLAALAIEPLMTTCADHQRAVGLATAGTAVAVLVVEAVARLPYPGPSTWNAAQHWLDERTPSGTTVLIEPYAPWLNPARYQVLPCGRVVDCPLPRGGYVVASEGMYGRFTEQPKTYPADAAAYQRLFQELPQVAIFDDPTSPVIRIFKVPAG
ncbi:MAG TPA: glycosyltransferase family 39 protein [Pseudonocardiaceae bacterium]|jgi:4-amino-4-deoxy-L-arabinose transferase-like glycosyltransferase|nr:glycosyltransferase family 39 protein [Pseudonocardiaceae bacterium]